MRKAKLVKNNIIPFGEVSKNHIVKFSFQLDDNLDGSNIDYVVPDCPVCTKVEYDKETNTIKGTLELSKAQTQYTQSTTPVNKVIMVFENDGEPQFVGDPVTKKRYFNDKKGVQRLTLAGIVKL